MRISDWSSDVCSSDLHEVVHWSGHASRLARTFGKRFGDKAYAFKELVAEIGAGLCCADLGLLNVLHDSHASYVGHWLVIMRGATSAIIHAAAQAEQAFAYLKSFAGVAADAARHEEAVHELGRESWREGECQYVSTS